MRSSIDFYRWSGFPTSFPFSSSGGGECEWGVCSLSWRRSSPSSRPLRPPTRSRSAMTADSRQWPPPPPPQRCRSQVSMTVPWTSCRSTPSAAIKSWHFTSEIRMPGSLCSTPTGMQPTSDSSTTSSCSSSSISGSMSWGLWPHFLSPWLLNCLSKGGRFFFFSFGDAGSWDSGFFPMLDNSQMSLIIRVSGPWHDHLRREKGWHKRFVLWLGLSRRNIALFLKILWVLRSLQFYRWDFVVGPSGFVIVCVEGVWLWVW